MLSLVEARRGLSAAELAHGRVQRQEECVLFEVVPVPSYRDALEFLEQIMSLFYEKTHGLVIRARQLLEAIDFLKNSS